MPTDGQSHGASDSHCPSGNPNCDGSDLLHGTWCARDVERDLLDEIANQARHWLAWFNEPSGAKTWDLNIVAAGTQALLRRLDEVRRAS